MDYFLEIYYLHSAELAPVLLYAALWAADPETLWPMQPSPTIESLRVDYSPAPPAQANPSTISLTRALSMMHAADAEGLLRNLRAGHLDLSAREAAGLPTIKTAVIPRPPVLQLDRHSENARNAWFMAPESRSSEAAAWVETFWPITDSANAHTLSIPMINLIAHMRASEQGRKAIQQIMSYLEGQTGLSFSKAYSQRMGCFEHYAFLHRFAGSGFSLRFVPRLPGPNGRATKGLVILRSESRRKEQNIAHVVLRNVRDIVLSEIVHLPEGVSESRMIASQERFSECEISIYNADGKSLVYHKHIEECRGFGMNAMMVSSRRRVSDSFYSTKLSHNPTLQQRAETVSEGIRSNITTEDFRDDPWYKISSVIQEVAGATSVRRSRSSRFFPKGDEGQVELVEYLQGLITAENVEEVILADPFFNAPALARLLVRIPHARPVILVITSLSGSAVEDLKLMLQRARTHLPRQLRVVNISRGDDQAFHDRYLYVVKTLADARLYVLSNSINNAAARWPFCVAEVDDVTARKVAEYLRRLAEGEDLYDENVTGIQPVTLWPTEQLAASARPRVDRRPLQERAWFRDFMTWLLDGSVDDYETQLRNAQDRGLLQCELGRLDNIRFIPERILASVDARIDDERHLQRVPSILLSLGEVEARSVPSDDGDEDADVAKRTKRLVEKYLGLPDADISKLLNALCSLAVTAGSASSPLAEESIRLLRDPTISLENLRATEPLLDNLQSWHIECWGLRHCLGVITVHYTPDVSDWVNASQFEPSVSLALMSAWADLCSYRKSPETARRLALESQGSMSRFFLSLAIGSRRCPPSMSLKESALVLEEVGVRAGERAVVLLSSLEDRRFNQEPDNWEDLLEAWPRQEFARGDEEIFWKNFKEFQLQELSALASAMSERKDGAKVKWLDYQIMRFVSKRYLSAEHKNSLLSHRDVDILDLALMAWVRSGNVKLSDLLPNKKEIYSAIVWLGRPFVRETFFSEWTKRVLFLSACGYVGARMCEVKPQHPDMTRFVPVFVPEIVVPILSQLTLIHFSQIDARVTQALARTLGEYLRNWSEPDSSSRLARRICASGRFPLEIRELCERFLSGAE